MGCCGNGQKKYEFDGKVKTISNKDSNTLNKVGRSAAAKIKVKNKIIECAKNIADLPYQNDSAKTLLSKEEFEVFMKKADDEEYKWNNYYQEYKFGDQKVEYKGYWNKERESIIGLGEMKFKDGSVYQGMISAKQFNGVGRMTRENGDIYQGEYVTGKAQGHGVFTDVEGSVYDGEWVNDKQHGKGVETWNDNGTMRYEGDFVEGAKTGKGKFEYLGSVYEGDFVDGKFHGEGKYFFADSGKIYRGQFVENQINGKGVMIFPDRTMYNGDFKDGKIEGHGIMNYYNGDRFIGQFKEDMKDGTGVWHDAAKHTKRQGTWAKDKRTGWIGQETESNVTAHGDLDENGEFTKRNERAYIPRTNKGGAWRKAQNAAPKLAAARQFRALTTTAQVAN